jgi:hypothetical protein
MQGVGEIDVEAGEGSEITCVVLDLSFIHNPNRFLKNPS